MKKLLIGLAAGLLSSTAYAGDMTIAGASKTGGYYAKAMKASERLALRGYAVNVAATQGSDEITLGVCSGKFTAGYTQIDAMFKRAKEGCVLRPVATYGDGELAMIFVPPNSKIDELSDLGKDSKILVNTIGSG